MLRQAVLASREHAITSTLALLQLVQDVVKEKKIGMRLPAKLSILANKDLEILVDIPVDLNLERKQTGSSFRSVPFRKV